MESKCCYLSPCGCALASKTHCPFIFERTESAEMFQLHVGLKEHLTVLGTQRNRNKSPCRTTHSKCRGVRAGTERGLEELGSPDLGQPRSFALKMDCVPASPSHRMLDSGDICYSFFLSLFLVTVGASEISIQFKNPNIFSTPWNRFLRVISLIALINSSRISAGTRLLFFNYRAFLFLQNLVWQILKKIITGGLLFFF